MYKVAVIGCGVVGLPTAMAIQDQLGLKAQVTIFTEKQSPDTTGDVAAGLWMPYSLQNTPQNKIIEWAKVTQDYIFNLWLKGDAKQAGIFLQPITAFSESRDFQLPEWVKITLGHSQLNDNQLKYYNQKFGTNFTGGYSFVAFIWEPSTFLPYLEKQFLDRGGVIKIQRIDDFAELQDFDVVVNCTGLYSRVLVPDARMAPVRGQVARVEAPWQYQTITIESDDANYVIVNEKSVVLGGTLQRGNFNTQVDEQDKERILKGCFRLVPSLEKAPVIKHAVGLRPGRDEVRLELEERRIGNRIMKIVHNYGHGGSGITLSIGCAVNAARLVREALGVTGQSKL